jgi:hypothetical protein
MRPVGWALRRLSDPRVGHFWDPGHLVATRIGHDESSPSPRCCTRKGFFWDLAAVFPAHVNWQDNAPPARFLDGTIVRVQHDLESALSSSIE